MEEQASKNKNKLVGIAVGVAVVVVLVLAIAVIFNGGFGGGLSQKAAETKVTDFINNQLLAGRGTATVKLTGSENGLYKLQITFQGQTIDSYMTKDGKKFFPQAMDISPASSTDAVSSSTADAAQQPAATVATKSNKPVVEAYVMSYCPYGTQIEKGLLPAIEALGNKIDFKIKFVSYTMHGDKEMIENTRQFCIQDEQNAKYSTYLKCFLDSSNADTCVASAGVNATQLKSCMDATTKKFNLTAGSTDFPIYAADNTKYGVQGSPTLVINGAQVESGRDSASLLKTICSAFSKAPSECQKQLSSAAPAAGFGSGTAAAGSTSAGCATN